MSVDSTLEFVESPAIAVSQQARCPARRGVLRVVARDLAIIVLLVLAAEITLRSVAPEYGHDYYDRTLTASQPVTFNAEGYRGPAVLLEKQAGERRIIAVGDSTTFGTGVAVEQTWPFQLRDRLQGDRTGDAVISVMNVALQGASLGDMAYAYDHKWSAYHPDVVTAMVSSNMIAMAYIRRHEPARMPPYILHAEPPATLKERIAREAGRLCLPHFLSLTTQQALYWLGVMDHRIADPAEPFGALLAHGWRQGDIPASEPNEAWACFAMELEQLHAAAQRHGVKLIVGFSPCRFDLSRSSYDNEKDVPFSRMTINPAARLASLCAAQGITCIDAPDALLAGRRLLTERRGETAPMYILFDYNHLNRDGHAAVADAFLPAVRAAVNTIPASAPH